MYNQQLQKQTSYSCTIYSMLNIIKYDYGVELKIDWILKIVVYMDKIGVLLPKGAYFSVIYPAMVKLIEWKTGFKLKISKKYISSGLDNISTWGLGFKKATKLYIQLSKDGEITKEDINKIRDGKGSGGHNHAIKLGNKSNKRTLLESLGGYPYTISYNNLKYARSEGLYRDVARTLIPANEKTKQAQIRLVALAKIRGNFISYDDFKKLYKNK